MNKWKYEYVYNKHKTIVLKTLAEEPSAGTKVIIEMKICKTEGKENIGEGISSKWKLGGERAKSKRRWSNRNIDENSNTSEDFFRIPKRHELGQTLPRIIDRHAHIMAIQEHKMPKIER